MNEYVNELEKELNFLTGTLRTDEKVFVPGDSEFNSYMDGIERLNRIVYSASKDDALARLEAIREENKAKTEALKLELEQHRLELEQKRFNLESKKEENKTQTEVIKIELERDKFELDKMERTRKLDFEETMAKKKLALDIRHETNRHEEELERIYYEHKEHNVAVISGTLEKVGIAGLLFGSVLLICGYEQNGVISKTALDVAGKMLRFVGMK